MRLLGFLFLIPLLISNAAAQEGKGWLGADVVDVTKAEADKLGWDTPHGAKLGVVASGSPADKVGLRTGNIIVSIDNVEPETATEADSTISAKSPGSELRLRIMSGGRERRVRVTLAERPPVQSMQIKTSRA
jgi:S1-C subfamily serine protease